MLIIVIAPITLVIMLNKENKELLFLAFFYVHPEFNFDVISDKLGWGPVSHLTKLLRFTKGFHRLVKSSTGRLSFH